MLTKQEFHSLADQGICLLDGATGSNLMLAGMPKGCCAEKWILEHPEAIIKLQRAYRDAGSQILYAPTFQAQPFALEKEGLADQTEKINASLVALSREAAPDCLIAGDLATMAASFDSWDPDNFDAMVEAYRRQIHGLIDGGVDLLVGETLLYDQEAEAILTAAALEGAECAMFTFTMQPDGSLFTGADAGKVLCELEKAGAAAVGFNCVPADMMTPHLVSKLRRYTSLPLICKPNAGNPVINQDGIAQYSLSPEDFTEIMKQCAANGAGFLGGCCGTNPDFIASLKQALK
jgi:5-methyltetrahydrofolate--homocysteine methyltransferase